MTLGGMHSLDEVISRVGPSILRVAVATDASLKQAVSGVTVYDPLVPILGATGEVLLAVGVDVCSPEALEVIRAADMRDFSAIVFHSDGSVPDLLASEARSSSTAILISPLDVPWAHLASIVRVGITSSAQELGGIPIGDLFGFANSLSARIGGAVTIEDPASHIVAYSSVKEEVDEPRKETILGRQVPQRYMRLLQERGVFRQLLASDDVVHMEAMPEVNLRRRVAISVRAAGELLGSIWVAETGRSLVEDHNEVLREAAQTAALHMMRHRLELQAESNLRTSMVGDLLDGTAADVAAIRLGLDPQVPMAVAAFEPSSPQPARNRLREIVDLVCNISARSAETIDIGPRVYALLSTDVDKGRALRFTAEAARRATSALHCTVLAGVGPVVSSAGQVVDSRRSADRVLRVLLRQETELIVADIDQVRASANLLEVLDLLRERQHLREGPLSELQEDGGDRGETLIATLRAYLDHMGDVGRAAATMNVHPNTLRYRLRRAAELGHIDLDDPTERLMLALQLRI